MVVHFCDVQVVFLIFYFLFFMHNDFYGVYRTTSYGPSHGLKIARQLSVFAPVYALNYCMVATGNH